MAQKAGLQRQTPVDLRQRRSCATETAERECSAPLEVRCCGASLSTGRGRASCSVKNDDVTPRLNPQRLGFRGRQTIQAGWARAKGLRRLPFTGLTEHSAVDFRHLSGHLEPATYVSLVSSESWRLGTPSVRQLSTPTSNTRKRASNRRLDVAMELRCHCEHLYVAISSQINTWVPDPRLGCWRQQVSMDFRRSAFRSGSIRFSSEG